MKDLHDIYTKNYKMSLREIWKDKLTEGYTVFTAWMIQYYKDNQLKN